MTSQLLIGEHPEGSGVGEGRDSAGSETGRPSDRVEIGPRRRRSVCGLGQRFDVEPPVTGNQCHHRFAVDVEHERLHDGGDVAADRPSGIGRGSDAVGERSHFDRHSGGRRSVEETAGGG